MTASTVAQRHRTGVPKDPSAGDVQSDWSRPAPWAGDDAVLDAITSAAGQDEADNLVFQSAAETLACGELDRDRFERLAPEAKAEVEAYLAGNNKLDWRPSWRLASFFGRHPLPASI